MSSKDNDEERVVHSKSDNDKKRCSYRKHFSISSLQISNLVGTSTKVSNFAFNCVHLLYCKSRKINFKRDGWYIESLDWIKNKKETINTINEKDNKCFRYSTTITLNYEKIGKHPERIAKIEPFIDKFNWEGINCPAEKYNSRKFEQNNITT